MFVDEVEPEEAVILTRATVHGEIEVGRHPARRENVPRRGDRENNQSACYEMQAAPDQSGKQLACDKQEKQNGASGNYDRDESLEQETDAEADRQQRSPTFRMWLGWFNRALK